MHRINSVRYTKKFAKSSLFTLTFQWGGKEKKKSYKKSIIRNCNSYTKFFLSLLLLSSSLSYIVNNYQSSPKEKRKKKEF